jgi:hypothetical protein
MSYTVSVAYAQPETSSRETKLGHIEEGVTTEEFLSNENTVFLRKETHTALMPWYATWRDIDPENRNSLRWGERCITYYANEYPSDQSGMTFHILLPALSPGAGNEAKWVPYIGERILGGIDGMLEIKHGQEVGRRYRPHEVSTKRRLCQNDIATFKRSAYLNQIGGADALDATVPQLIQVQVWLPQAPDTGRTLDHMLPMQAFSEEFELRFRIPPLNELVWTNTLAVLNTLIAANTRPDIFVRSFFFVMPQEQRAASARQVLEKGWTTKVIRPTTERDVEVVANAAAVEVAVDLEYTKLPVTCLIVEIHYKDDLVAAGTAQTAADTNPDPTLVRTNAGTIVRPNWRRHVAPTQWWLQEGPERVTPKYDMHSWLNDPHGWAGHFPSTPSPEYGVLPFALHPAIETDSTGHTDLTTMVKPRLHVIVPPNDAFNAGQIRVIRVTGWCHNTFGTERGTIRPGYNQP